MERASLGERRQQIRQSRNQLLLSVVLGALVGLVVIAFLLVTGRMAARMYPAGGAPWRRILVPTLGSLITGFLLYQYFPLARGSGVPQTKFALFVEDGYIKFRTVLGKFFLCSASLASGIALGREGPAVQIGAGLASVIGRRLGLSKEQVQSLVPVGAAAALAAAFNTPIAAVLFTLEEIMGDLHAPVLGSVVVSSATAWIMLHLLLGDQPLFRVAGYRLVHPLEFAIYAVLGVAGGLGSVCFVKLLLALRERFMRLPQWTVWFQPVAGGLTVGLMGWFAPAVMGVGYNYVERVLNGDLVLTTVAVLAVLKIIASAVCYASGNAGGIFSPSLFIGAMIGASVGSVAHSLLPGYTAEPGAYALVGMGAAFAGIVRAPLTSVIMVFEVTRDYTIIVPLMISNLIAFFISYALQREPIYEALARQEGVYLPTSEPRSPRARIRVLRAMLPATEVLSPQMEVAEALNQAEGSRFNAWPIADQDGMCGVIGKAELQSALAHGWANKKLAELVDGCSPQDRRNAKMFAYVHSDHPLGVALERMGASGRDVLPVVSRANRRRLIGVITLDSILKSYGVTQTLESESESQKSR
ncbi:MAG TPA: chloride channel protein [Bryobacteraceae bacterium]|jgi:CIC family chloride channel protein|nr:chloride channel protein [Bryobacteraceae bacterium]